MSDPKGSFLNASSFLLTISNDDITGLNGCGASGVCRLARDNFQPSGDWLVDHAIERYLGQLP